MKKKIIFKFSFYSSTLSLRILSEISLLFFTSFFIVRSRGSNENESFRRIIAMKDKLELILNERVKIYINGIYLKHHLRKWVLIWINCENG